MKYSKEFIGVEQRCVKITYRKGKFLRMDFVSFAFTVSLAPIRSVSITGTYDCLLEFGGFYAALDDSACEFREKTLTSASFKEALAIFQHFKTHGASIQMPRFWRFFRKAFPEYVAP